MTKRIGLYLTLCVSACAVESEPPANITATSTVSANKAPSAAPTGVIAQPIAIKASVATREMLNIDRWSTNDSVSGHRLLALDATGYALATLSLRDLEGGKVQFALADSHTAAVTLATDGQVSGDDPKLVKLAKAFYADLQTQNATSRGEGAAPQVVNACGQEVLPGDTGVCGTVFLGESLIGVTNNSGCWAYVWSDALNQYATGIDDWIAIAPYGTVSFLRWYWGSNVSVLNWEGDCGTITVHH